MFRATSFTKHIRERYPILVNVIDTEPAKEQFNGIISEIDGDTKFKKGR